MAKTLSEAQAWLLLAKAWSKAKFCDDCDQFHATVCGDRYCSGICLSISAMFQDDSISEKTAASMREKLETQAPFGKTAGCFWEKDAKGAAQRAAVCRELAKETAPKKRRAAK